MSVFGGSSVKIAAFGARSSKRHLKTVEILLLWVTMDASACRSFLPSLFDLVLLNLKSAPHIVGVGDAELFSRSGQSFSENVQV